MSEQMAIRVADARPLAGFRPFWGSVAQMAVPGPLPEGAMDPYADGYAQGVRDAEQAFAAERARTAELLAACGALRPEPSEELALLIAETVDRLVRITVGEVAIDQTLLNGRARRAAALVAEADAARTLHVHPEDLALIETAALPLALVGDPGLPRGTVRIENSTGWVEDGVSIHLETLREQLGLREGAE